MVQFCYLIMQVFVSESVKADSDTMNRELQRILITKHLSNLVNNQLDVLFSIY